MEEIPRLIRGALEGDGRHAQRLYFLAEKNPDAIFEHISDEDFLHLISTTTQFKPHHQLLVRSLLRARPERVIPLLENASFENPYLPKQLIADIYDLARAGKVDRGRAAGVIHKLMSVIYSKRYGTPPEPRNPSLPKRIEHEVFDRQKDLEGINPQDLARAKAIRKVWPEMLPKDAYEWIAARVRASSDCTVPHSLQAGFIEHTVPYYFAGNAATYKIMAEHHDTRRGGKGARVRKNRHVGNVYLSEIRTKDGRKVLYVSGIQIHDLYKHEINSWIGEAVVNALRDMAKEQGYHELWIHADLLSHYVRLLRNAVNAALRHGGKEIQPRLEELDYIDLPADHYAAPHKGRVVAIRLR